MRCWGILKRHNGNWGFLIDEKNKCAEIAPIYDCGSCLYPHLEDKDIDKILNDKNEIEARVYVFPNSALKIADKKINYYDYITSLENLDCCKALKRVYSKIHLDEIFNIIDNIEVISFKRKAFYKTIIKERYDLILGKAFSLLNRELI